MIAGAGVAVTGVDSPGLYRGMALAGVVAVVAAVLGIGVPSTFGAHVAVDEPQYLLTALSLAEDRSLDISDELAERRWVPWGGAELPVQTEVLDGGAQISPHDPLLPLVLAIPMRLGGWVAAKAVMALTAGALAVLTLWTAVRRFAVPLKIATAGVAIAAASAPAAVYGQQVYPEAPAALAVVGAVALLGTPRIWAFAAVVSALPWLSVKYVPVALALAALGLWRTRSKALPAAFAVMGALYLAVHRLIWGGWTVYASGDHFQNSGEWGVMGFAPDLAGRALRLTGLLVDQGYGLAAWQPAWLLLVPALALGIRRVSLVLPLAAGWLTATFAAVTMHGFWWPGRQLVVVLPLALILILCWLDRTWKRVAAAALGLSGVLTYAWLVADGLAGRLTWVSGFQEVASPVYQAVANVLPDYRRPGFWPAHLAWAAVLVLLFTINLRKSHVRA
ncbi:hypothetical protein ACIBHY_28135 [Nonomuraea sp. NPDC050547]|uniref:hypothetical protein n=1 Tax=unclassified Nonomuraea TaxID=2593643 RepID=UPI00378AE806